MFRLTGFQQFVKIGNPETHSLSTGIGPAARKPPPGWGAWTSIIVVRFAATTDDPYDPDVPTPTLATIVAAGRRRLDCRVGSADRRRFPSAD